MGYLFAIIVELQLKRGFDLIRTFSYQLNLFTL